MNNNQLEKAEEALRLLEYAQAEILAANTDELDDASESVETAIDSLKNITKG